MLTIHVNKSAEGLVNYFTNGLSKDDYFFSKDAIKGRWIGSLKTEFGLPDTVSRKTFARLAHGLHPRTGQSLSARQVKNRRASIEYTFACPKSVSIIMALSDQRTAQEILNAHRLAVKKTMVEIEADLKTQTTVNGRKLYAEANGILAARFDHFTSRPVKDRDFDPGTKSESYSSDMHLHSHVVVMNLTRFGDGYQAIEGSPVHRTAEYYEALYHSWLSKTLSDLGFAIRRTEKRWEIDTPGLTRRTIEKFSRRTLQIEAAAQKIVKTRGGISAKTKGALGAKLRVSKSRAGKDIDLVASWRNRLTLREAQAISQAIAQVRNLAKSPRRISHASPPLSAEKALDLAMRHHYERRSVVPTKKVLARAMAFGYGQLTPQQVKAALKDRKDVVYAERGYVDYMTTRNMIRAENAMIATAAHGKNTCAPIHPDYEVQRDFLNEDQRDAIHQVLCSKDKIQILSGAAGSGKSTLLVELKMAAAQKGLRISAFAPSSGASRDVLRSKGFENADTIAAFLRNQKLQEHARGQIILIDECSMVGVKTMNKIFRVSDKLKARVILSGDPRQMSSPEAGDAARILMDKAAIKPARVDKILRQRANPKLKIAIEDLARGQVRMGYKKLEKQNAICEIEDVDARHAALARAYVRSLAAGRSALVIAPTHGEIDKVTVHIRTQMKAKKLISGAEVRYQIERPLSLTAAQKESASSYEEKMVVRFHQNAKGGFKAGGRYQVVGVDHKTGRVQVKAPQDRMGLDLPLRESGKFELSRPDYLSLAAGDRIRINRNGRTMDRRRLYNGAVYTVEGFTPQGHIRLNGGRVIDKSFGTFAYGFAETSFSVQGKDAQDVFIAQSAMSLPATHAKQFYVSASRAKESLIVYTDDKEAQREAVMRSGDRMSAVDLATQEQRRTRKRNTRKRNRQVYLNKVKTFIKDYGRIKKAIKGRIQIPGETPAARIDRTYE